jgi:hypothetical protein
MLKYNIIHGLFSVLKSELLLSSLIIRCQVTAAVDTALMNNPLSILRLNVCMMYFLENGSAPITFHFTSRHFCGGLKNNAPATQVQTSVTTLFHSDVGEATGEYENKEGEQRRWQCDPNYEI